MTIIDAIKNANEQKYDLKRPGWPQPLFPWKGGLWFRLSATAIRYHPSNLDILADDWLNVPREQPNESTDQVSQSFAVADRPT